MPNPRTRSSRNALVIALAMALMSSPLAHGSAAANAGAAPQTAEELKQQIADLKEQLQKLKSQQTDAAERARQCANDLQRAIDRIRELEAAQAARPAGTSAAPGSSEPGRGSAAPSDGAGGGASPPSAPVDPNAPTPAPPAPAAPAAPSNPFENSATLSEAIKARFTADFAGRPAPQEGMNDDRLTRLWMTEIERWANLVNREMRRPITWTVRVLNAEASGKSWRLDVVCVDPVQGTDIGRPFSIQLQAVQAASFEQSMKLGKGGSNFLLRGVFIPQIAINPSRFEPGPFDSPPFIGTFLEFGYRINVTSLIRAEDRAPAKGPPRTPSTAPSSTPPSGVPGATPSGAPPAGSPGGAPPPAPAGGAPAASP